MDKIDREDMLELTRRMTLKRNCFSRIAGAYIDEEGYIDGTFNTHFLKLSPRDQSTNLRIAKAIPFSETNVNLKEYQFQEKDKRAGSTWQLLMGLRECELKNDALLDLFYEAVGKKYGPRDELLLASTNAVFLANKNAIFYLYIYPGEKLPDLLL